MYFKIKKKLSPLIFTGLKKRVTLLRFNLLFTTGPRTVVNLVIVCVCQCVRASVRHGICCPDPYLCNRRNFLILDMMMGYGLGMTSIIFCIWSVIPDAQTKTSVSEISSNKHIHQVARHPCCPLHKIGASCKRGLQWLVCVDHFC